MILGLVRESFPGENRVAITPHVLKPLAKAGFSVLLEPGAGLAAGFTDAAYEKEGAKLAPDRAAVFAQADVLAQVRTHGANPVAGQPDLALLRPGQIVVGACEPLAAAAPLQELAGRNVVALAMELMPRITRAQTMDALSSQATIAGYKAVVLVMNELPRMFPMMITAAGTVAPAKVFVIGAGVAGLQAIATAKRNGAIVSAYDIRPAVREQVQSVGGRFVEVPLEAQQTEDKGGYARAMDDTFYRRQRELLADTVAQHDAVITTAAVPGKKSPVLVTREMVERMQPGSVIVDLAAERGGNCEPTVPNERVVVNGVTILGPTNLPATTPYHASQMYARNMQAFLTHLARDGAIDLDRDDEILRETLLTRAGQIVHRRVREILGLPPLEGAAT